MSSLVRPLRDVVLLSAAGVGTALTGLGLIFGSGVLLGAGVVHIAFVGLVLATVLVAPGGAA
jgi:hypothetical protein